jgi:predicted acylesterase/phospholipase RssA
MLTVEPAVRKRRSQRRLALALAGGGPLGAFYELGCLHALAECTEGLNLTDLDGYVGVSSGAILAAALANGLSTVDIARSFFVDDPTVSFPLTPGLLMRPALGEYLKRALSVPTLVAKIVTRLVRNPFGQTFASLLSPLVRVIPTGIFDNRPFERYMRRLLTSEGRTNDFRKLPHRLRIVATDLNSGEEVCFGNKGFDQVPISVAIRASTALPGLYIPVRLGGHTYVDGALLRTAHASLELDQGADLVISVNPLVTFDASRPKTRKRHLDLADDGFTVVMSQMFRALIQSRMRVGMASYGGRYPFSDRLLFEPDRDDETMFFVNVFRYSERKRLAEHAYQRTRQDMLARAAHLAPVLRRHGIRLRDDRLRDDHRTFSSGLEADETPNADHRIRSPSAVRGTVEDVVKSQK